MNILVVAHKNPYTKNPRGGETSVRIICDYLKRWHNVEVWCHGGDDSVLKALAAKSDIALTWGKAAHKTASLGIPYILMVRFWRNVQPLPVGDLLNGPVDKKFQKQHQPIFSDAKAVITNNLYSKSVIERIYGVEATVSYVPVEGEVCGSGNPKGYLTLITPEIYGEYPIVKRLAQRHKFLVVNSGNRRFKSTNNIRVEKYLPADQIYKQTKILLTPTYHHDICGTRRTPIEAMRYGIPVISNDRCGISEKVPNCLRRNAPVADWERQINRVIGAYAYYSNMATRCFESYNTGQQLEVFKRLCER